MKNMECRYNIDGNGNGAFEDVKFQSNKTCPVPE